MMANLVRIEKVFLYMGWTANAADTYAAMKALDDAGIKYTKLCYNEPEQHKANFDALSSWTFGDESAPYNKSVTDFPFLHWTEVYDDYNKYLYAAHGLDEVKASKLLSAKVPVI
jgi:hypothetical protein